MENDVFIVTAEEVVAQLREKEGSEEFKDEIDMVGSTIERIKKLEGDIEKTKDTIREKVRILIKKIHNK